MRGREDQNTSILADDEVALFAPRFMDDDRRRRPHRVNVRLGLSRAGAQRRTAGCNKQHQKILHLEYRKGDGLPLRERPCGDSPQG